MIKFMKLTRKDNFFLVSLRTYSLYAIDEGAYQFYPLHRRFDMMNTFTHTYLRSFLTQVHSATHQARMEVAHVELSAGRSPKCGHLDLLQLSLLQSFRLGPPVLEPDFHLGFGQSQGGREFGAFGYAEVLLLAEFLLERQQLLGGEGGARFAVGLVLAQVALDSWGFLVVCVERKVEKRGLVIMQIFGFC
jgi:hypothetical protein